MTPQEIHDQIFKSYIRLRLGLAALAFAFPIGLWVIGTYYGIKGQNSMSAYYFAQHSLDELKYAFPMRAWFVGVLWAIGAFLYLYKGFSRTENFFLNAAGLSAIAVALFPMEFDFTKCVGCGSNNLAIVHYIAAGFLFFCMGVVAWACSDETLAELPDDQRQWWRWGYSALAIAMWIAPLVAFVLAWRGRKEHPGIFYAELVGIVIFAIYWGIKSCELDLLKTEKRKLSGTGLPTIPPPPSDKKMVDEKDKPKAAALMTTVGDKVDAARQTVGTIFDKSSVIPLLRPRYRKPADPC
jgi:hypothetical protein